MKRLLLAALISTAVTTSWSSLARAEDSEEDVVNGPGALADRNPLGQATYLKVDNNGSRTSSTIRSGELRRTVMGVNNTNPQDPGFNVRTHCKVQILFLGTKEGEVTSPVKNYIFSSQFIDDMRAGQIYNTADVKIRHLGFKDATNMDGHRYMHADELLLYDINPSTDAGGFGLNCLANAMLDAARAEVIEKGGTVDDKAAIENMQIRVLLHPDAPVLGEVKLDMTGVYNGTNVKMGGDYLAP